MLRNTIIKNRIYPVNQLALIAKAMRDRGVPFSHSIEGTHLTEKELKLSTTKVTSAQVLKMISNACAFIPDPSFAFEVGLGHHLSTFGTYGFAILSAPSLRQACYYAAQYSEISHPLVNISFREHDNSAIWTLSPKGNHLLTRAVSQFIIEMHIGIGISLHQEILGSDYKPKKIELTYASTNLPESSQLLNRCPIQCLQLENRVLLDANWLEHSPNYGDPLSYEHMVEQSRDLLRDFDTEMGIVREVRSLILSNISMGMDQTSICERLAMSPRTLRRALQAEHTSFQKIYDDVRRQLATKYLCETSLTVESIAADLGFSDTANFRKSFIRITGMTPQEMRNKMRT